MTVTYDRLESDVLRARRIAALLRGHLSGRRRLPSSRIAALYAIGAGCQRRILGAVAATKVFHG